MTVMETDRLILRKLTVDDAEFMLRLLNDEAWRRYIGDRGIRTVEGARDYIVNGPMESYERLGFGLFLTELKEESTPIGLCGLIKRDSLTDEDIGFAFLPEFRGRGYAYEAAAATLEYGRSTLDLERIVAITTVDNERSGYLLEKIGMKLEGHIAANKEELKLYASCFPGKSEQVE
ncbi:GNAT family N-acetyltransferase [Paenibacillus alvei]|uniref:GNAT family N-acetyltransferase n=1 Tax=Paenibacillus alvei TaxID=44250 RepID=UPI0003857CD2|nr:GNAT family N-acetyltransferase [Paenibacillus alvei]EPY14220.1 N-acetyltransferase GCN5 [Paenibacillus alvei A6-6i-x]